MTEKSNELSDKDKVTQASEEEVKGIEKENPTSLEDQNSAAVETEIPDASGEEVSVEAIPVSAESTEEVIPESMEEITPELSEEVASVSTPEASPESLEDETEVAEASTASQEESPAAAAQSVVEQIEAEAVPSEMVDSASELVSEMAAAEAVTESKTESSEEEEEHIDEHVELAGLSKVQLLKLLKDKLQHSSILKLDKLAHEIKAAFDELVAKDKEEALARFKADGGSADDFEYRQHEEEREFSKTFNDFRYQLNSLRKEAERLKEKNLIAKTDLLNKLRELVDGEETTLSMNSIKAIQDQWKSIGPVPNAQSRNLWASFNALMDRFYDNRSIYFELKELDRKKNLESKLELCEKAEALKDHKDLKEAIRQATLARSWGAKGLMMLPPMRYSPDHRECVTYFKAVAEHVDLPVMIYNNPVDYKTEVTLDMFEELINSSNIQAIKESTRDISNVTRLRNRFGNRLSILCGVDTLAMEELVMGADGWVAGLVCAYPRETVTIFKLIKAGRIAEAREIYRWFLPLLELDIHAKLVQYIKLAEFHEGIGTEYVRAPRLTLIGEERAQVEHIIKTAQSSRPQLPQI